MQFLHSLARTRAVFDDPNLLPSAGLALPLALAECAGLPALLAAARPAGPCGADAAAKAVCLVMGMAAGADSIDGIGLLRDGATQTVFGGIRAPSALASFLRSFTRGNVRQLDAAHRKATAALAAGPRLLPGKEELAFIDLPSGAFNANAARLALAAMAFNLPRAAGTRYSKARTATVRRDLITVPARTARRGRSDLVLHLPAGHHREHAWLALRTDATGPPAAAA